MKFLSFLLVSLLCCNHSSAQQLKLWYKQPAQKWTDALPIGNGRLGAMIFGGIGQDRVQFNEETLWTGEPRKYNRRGAHQYLSQIRSLLAEGKQKEAEKLAELHFMGLKSNEGKKAEWITAMRSGKGMNGNPSQTEFNDKGWKEMWVPSYEGWEAMGFEGLDGALWFRRTFELPAGWTGKDLVLDLNRIRETDFTYVNGTLVGSMESTEPRKYTIPKEVLRPGINTIAVQVLNFSDKGGIGGYKDTSRPISIYPQNDEGSKLSLVGLWKYFVQNDEPPAVPKYQADYQPFGDLLLTFTGKANARDYRRELDLRTAISRTMYSAGDVQFTREYLASQPDGSIVIHLSASRPGNISFEAGLSSPHKASSLRKLNDSTIALLVKVRNGALRGESWLQVRTTNGKVTVSDNRFVVNGADNATLYLSAGTNYKNFRDISADPAATPRAALAGLKNRTYRDTRARHIAEYTRYFNTFQLSFEGQGNEDLPTDERLNKFNVSNDPSFVALYAQYGRYLLISSSRPGSRPANLQGIWNDLLSPPWGSKYTTNINAEMNYWPAENLNLSPLHEPLLTMVEELSKAGALTAKEYYNAPGWVVHHNTDLWRGTAPINASNHGIWVTGGGWLSHHLWEHYLYTQNKTFLQQRGYPVMKEAARFFLHFLVRDPKTGWLISTPSNSPEQGGLVAGPSMDHQIIRSLFKAVISAGDLLKKDKPFIDSLRRTLAQIAPDQVGKHGQLQEWLQDIDDPANRHRHVSHLWAVYPGKEINWDGNDTLMKAARQSLLLRGDAATGWSLGWKINLWARFKDGDHAYKLIQMLLSPADKGGAGSYRNLFDAHPPFQIDGNFGGAAGIGELLVQSHTDYIDLLPALPSALGNGQVKGIRARGGFELDLVWKEGELQSVQLLSLAGNEARIRYKGKVVRLKTLKGKTYSLTANLLALR